MHRKNRSMRLIIKISFYWCKYSESSANCISRSVTFGHLFGVNCHLYSIKFGYQNGIHYICKKVIHYDCC